MSGHSKWHSIKHKKAAKDSKRGKLFGKLVKAIESELAPWLTARQERGDFSGYDPDADYRALAASLDSR